jgi:hypothetical protein
MSIEESAAAASLVRAGCHAGSIRGVANRECSFPLRSLWPLCSWSPYETAASSRSGSFLIEPAILSFPVHPLRAVISCLLAGFFMAGSTLFTLPNLECSKCRKCRKPSLHFAFCTFCTSRIAEKLVVDLPPTDWTPSGWFIGLAQPPSFS